MHRSRLPLLVIVTAVAACSGQKASDGAKARLGCGGPTGQKSGVSSVSHRR